MGSTIVRIAGRRAIFMSPGDMTTELSRVEFHLDRDLRLAAAVRSAVHFQASHAGLDEPSCDGLAKASEEVCRQTLSQLQESEVGLKVTLETFSDRIEICIHQHGQVAPAVGLDAFAAPHASDGGSSGLNGTQLLERVDRVTFQAQDGVARTTLVKFLHANR
jgi:hypothetical protein